MNMPANGTLNPIEKIRTESKAQRAMVDMMKELCENGIDYNDCCWISCSCHEEQANKVVEMVNHMSYLMIKTLDLLIY